MARYDRGYDYGLRGWRQTAQRPPVRTRFMGEGYGRDDRGGYGGGYGADYAGGRGGWGRGYGSDYRSDDRSDYRVNPFPNRVTQRYNMEYVRPERHDEYRVNWAPYGGDRIGRVGDLREYHAPYQTIGGSRTWRGEWPMDWERDHGRYDWEFPNYRADYGRWF